MLLVDGGKRSNLYNSVTYMLTVVEWKINLFHYKHTVSIMVASASNYIALQSVLLNNLFKGSVTLSTT